MGVAQNSVVGFTLYHNGVSVAPTFPLTDTTRNVPSGTELLVISVTYGLTTGVGNQGRITAVSWDGVAMTKLTDQVCGANSESYASMWYLANPNPGTKTLSVSGTTSGSSLSYDVSAGFHCFNGGVNQATPLSGFATATTESATSLGATTTEAVSTNEMGIALYANGSGGVSSTTPSDSDDYTANSSSANQLGTLHGGSSTGTGSTMSFTENWSPSDHGIVIVARVQAATVSPALPLLSPITGIGIPGRPPVAQMQATGVEPNALGYVTPLEISRFLNPLTLTMGPVIFPTPQPYFPSTGAVKTITATVTIVWSETVSLVKTAVLTPTSNIVFTESATLVKIAKIAETANITFTETVNLVKTAVLTPVSNITFTESATLVKIARVAASVGITFAETVNLVKTAVLTETSNITFAVTTNLINVAAGARARMPSNVLPTILRMMEKWRAR